MKLFASSALVQAASSSFASILIFSVINLVCSVFFCPKIKDENKSKGRKMYEVFGM
jgi:hypothetical protein